MNKDSFLFLSNLYAFFFFLFVILFTGKDLHYDI